MKLSVTNAQVAGDWKVAKRAEELGYHTAWYEDSQMAAADPVVVMAAAAMHTSRIRLGSSVIIPSNRIAPQTANSFATLNSYAPGRINLGIGSGFSGRRAMGLGPVKMKDIRNYVEVINGLLQGKTLEWDFENQRRKIRFINADHNVTNLTDPIDIYIGAQGPKMRQMTAELKAHWMSIFTTIDGAAADFAAMKKARIAAGSSPEGFKSAITFFGYPLVDGEDVNSPRVRRQAGPAAAVGMHNVLEMEEQLGTLGTDMGVDKDVLEKYRRLYQGYQPADARYLSLHRGHAMFMREDEKDLITPDWIRLATMTRPIGEVRECFRELKRIGFDEVSFLMNTTHPADIDMLERWVEVMEGV